MDLSFLASFSIYLSTLSYVLRTDILTMSIVVVHIIVVGHDKQISDYLGSNMLRLIGLCMHLHM